MTYLNLNDDSRSHAPAWERLGEYKPPLDQANKGVSYQIAWRSIY